MKYGALPEVIGKINISPVEMMCWMYCPLKVPHGALIVPHNLRQFFPIIDAVLADEPDRFDNEYVYITAKTLFVSGGYIGNRPGWHTDGFGTDDVNYIWSDHAPTEFYAGPEFDLPSACDDAMSRMEQQARDAHKVTYATKTLLKLNPFVVHRPPISFDAGMRSFVKVSISRDRYNLEGNSVNHGLAERWPLVPRHAERNHPSRSAA